MKNSVRLGRIAGVEVGFHWSLLVIAAPFGQHCQVVARQSSKCCGQTQIESLLASGMRPLRVAPALKKARKAQQIQAIDCLPL